MVACFCSFVVSLLMIIGRKMVYTCMQIYWGHGVYDVEAASDMYFGKHLSLLNIGECAMLAGIIPAPELYSPFRDPSRFVWFEVSMSIFLFHIRLLDTDTEICLCHVPWTSS